MANGTRAYGQRFVRHQPEKRVFGLFEPFFEVCNFLQNVIIPVPIAFKIADCSSRNLNNVNSTKMETYSLSCVKQTQSHKDTK